jgi:hypothetical protein
MKQWLCAQWRGAIMRVRLYNTVIVLKNPEIDEGENEILRRRSITRLE